MIKRGYLLYNLPSVNEYVADKNNKKPIQVVVKDVILINDYKLKIIYNNGAAKNIELVNNSIKNFEYVIEGNKIIIETNNNDKFEIEIPIDEGKWELVEGLLRTKDGVKITLHDISEIDSVLGAEDKFLNKKGEFVTPSHPTLNDILYADLLTLINNSELIPNSSYRITDYTTTTVQADTVSTVHDFDIIVTALSTNELSEVASCVKKEGDTYFANAKLEAWEIKYCINNDTSRFAWADAVNGKGVIYYMKDEWNNECPYDFKNIQFKKSYVFLYTFGGTTDDSLTGGCHHNTMMAYTLSSVLTLNFNTFGNNCASNLFGTGCDINTFGNNCYSNKFGNSCSNNKFGDDCASNTFGDGSASNTFGDGCASNTFETTCSNNTFGINCRYNSFGNWCQYNSFGNYCENNTFGNWCSSNSFGNYCENNTFGNWCYSNSFGNTCKSNTFGNNCFYNNFYAGISGTIKKNYIQYIVLEKKCSYNNFYSDVTTSFANPLQRIRIKGLEFDTPTDTQITLSATNTKYEWVVAKNSSGDVKQYCPEDLLS